MSTNVRNSPFLAFVSDVEQFDSQLSQYVNRSYVQQRYISRMSFHYEEQLNYVADTSNYSVAAASILRIPLLFTPDILQV